jgi:hypothetical protein
MFFGSPWTGQTAKEIDRTGEADRLANPFGSQRRSAEITYGSVPNWSHTARDHPIRMGMIVPQENSLAGPWRRLHV